MKRLATAVITSGALAAGTILLGIAPVDADEPTPTCQGQEATVLGVPDGKAQGTNGNDVIVSNDAETVIGGAGDDLICVTGIQEWVDVRPGRGDDTVDTTAVSAQDTVWTALAVGTRPSGDDTYIGGPAWDEIVLDGGSAEDHKTINTGGGSDDVTAYTDYPGTTDVSLGSGDDLSLFEGDLTRHTVNGGAGPDEVFFLCADCSTMDVDLAAGTFVIDGQDHGVLAGFESAEIASADESPILKSATLSGTADGDYLDVVACDITIDGRGGNDRILAYSAKRCDKPHSKLIGGPGNDLLYGTRQRDTLLGRAGKDRAFGGRGSDLCRAEIKKGCER